MVRITDKEMARIKKLGIELSKNITSVAKLQIIHTDGTRSPIYMFEELTGDIAYVVEPELNGAFDYLNVLFVISSDGTMYKIGHADEELTDKYTYFTPNM